MFKPTVATAQNALHTCRKVQDIRMGRGGGWVMMEAENELFHSAHF